MSARQALSALLRSFTVLGLLLGTLFVAASLTPSLVPRHPAVQGMLSGLCFAAGYGIGVLVQALWRLLQLPEPRAETMIWRRAPALLLCLGAISYALWRANEWQNRLRALMQLAPQDSAGPFTIAGVALLTFALLLLIGRAFDWVKQGIAARLKRQVPGPVAVLTALGLTAWLFYSIGNGVLVRAGMHAFDASYRRLDALIEDDSSPRPSDPLKVGAPGSLLKWEDLGRAGRRVIAAGPDRAAIAQMTDSSAAQVKEPLRVYVGLNSADTVEARAQLALAELKRIGAFERSNMVIVTPTGTGWVDPESQTALEYLLRGDVASVSVQYSYLASWLALLADPELGRDTARATFTAVYDHWRSLPRDKRPKLYLHGLSLGSLNSDLSHDLHQVIGDPYDGAFWAGPPFASETWNLVTAQRKAGTPAWLPEFRDGSVIRFTAQVNRLNQAPAAWGPYRVIYLQYASDAVSFFDPGALWRRPAWLQAPLGPDVSPDFVWVPVVTFLQLTIDLMLATTPPLGYGHLYAFEHYLDGWAGLTDAPGWTPEQLQALKNKIAARR
ncbi:alpha/beta hydrolase [Roseateles albus]|uniref:Alpha/beta-hydrolase family protein n=1 Tax=Roseateles albus TaxID=2987525 RepID=A0ABT5K935_9BURK|nr:alpha/beta-hydrolase family protein [Roseateles albus]MDC8770471.1 alpha/beta-hydrolase family protein [Roseateles albus]